VSVAVSARLGMRTDLQSVQIHGRSAEQCTQVRVASARGAMLREHAETATLQISASGRSALDWRLTSDRYFKVIAPRQCREIFYATHDAA
jgi:hypothetical protein